MRTDWQIISDQMDGFTERLTRRLPRPGDQQYRTESAEYSGKNGTGKLIRKVFVPQEGYVFIDADYSQIELRILAHCSGDAHLIQAYREAQDIHRMTASQVFKTPFDEVTDLQRRNAKHVNVWNCLRDQFVWIESGLEYHEKRSVSVY